MNIDYYWDDQLREHLKDDPDNFCQYCERPIAKGKLYCSDSCREADYCQSIKEDRYRG